jgi:hypothetical protein
MAALPEELAYAEAVRAIAHQAALLDGLRSRAGILLGATSLVMSFFGATALTDRDVSVWSALAIASFLGVAFLWKSRRNDWIIDCAVQLQVRPQLHAAIASLSG